jgi:hypothetical protein
VARDLVDRRIDLGSKLLHGGTNPNDLDELSKLGRSNGGQGDGGKNDYRLFDFHKAILRKTDTLCKRKRGPVRKNRTPFLPFGKFD